MRRTHEARRLSRTRASSYVVGLAGLVSLSVFNACSSGDEPSGTEQSTGGSTTMIPGTGGGSGASPGSGGTNAPSSGGTPSANTGGAGPSTSSGGAGTGGVRPSGGAAGSAGATGLAGAGGTPGSGGAGGSSGSPGSGGAAGAAGTAGAAGGGSMGPTAVCFGGTVGKDSDAMRPPGLTVSREWAAVKYLAARTNQILDLTTTMVVPKTPTAQQTLFIWPGLQCQGASDPARIGNGILQPVLTWGPSCAPKAPQNGYASWWMAAMYVNVSSAAAGPTGCAGGDYMATPTGDELLIDMAVNGTAWTQTITDLKSMKKVDLTTDLKAQVQNWATWAIEIPSGETIRPAEDVTFTGSVITFASAVTSCQPSQAGKTDYFSAPVLSKDGLHCCYDKIVLRAQH